jgi:hypothetical protein
MSDDRSVRNSSAVFARAAVIARVTGRATTLATPVRATRALGRALAAVRGVQRALPRLSELARLHLAAAAPAVVGAAARGAEKNTADERGEVSATHAALARIERGLRRMLEWPARTRVERVVSHTGALAGKAGRGESAGRAAALGSPAREARRAPRVLARLSALGRRLTGARAAGKAGAEARVAMPARMRSALARSAEAPATMAARAIAAGGGARPARSGNRFAPARGLRAGIGLGTGLSRATAAATAASRLERLVTGAAALAPARVRAAATAARQSALAAPGDGGVRTLATRAMRSSVAAPITINSSPQVTVNIPAGHGAADARGLERAVADALEKHAERIYELVAKIGALRERVEF